MKGFKLYRIFENQEDLAEFAGEEWRRLQNGCGKLFIVSSPLSSTPLPLYRWVKENANSFTNWDKFRFVLMDEQVESSNEYNYVSNHDPASYERFAKINLLDHLKQKGFFNEVILKPDLKNLKAFDKFLQEEKGIDLLILAIGAKGHYAQVMPNTSLDTGFHIAKLIPELGQVHTAEASKSYSGAHFREYGMSLGPMQVLAAKNIIFMVTGDKRALLSELMSHDSFSQDFPSSIIFHPAIKQKVQFLLSRECL